MNALVRCDSLFIVLESKCPIPQFGLMYIPTHARDGINASVFKPTLEKNDL